MSNICYECDDYVSEYGEPICLGCFRAAQRKHEESVREIERLKTLLKDHGIAFEKPRPTVEVIDP